MRFYQPVPMKAVFPLYRGRRTEVARHGTVDSTWRLIEQDEGHSVGAGDSTYGAIDRFLFGNFSPFGRSIVVRFCLDFVFWPITSQNGWTCG